MMKKIVFKKIIFVDNIFLIVDQVKTYRVTFWIKYATYDDNPLNDNNKGAGLAKNEWDFKTTLRKSSFFTNIYGFLQCTFVQFFAKSAKRIPSNTGMRANSNFRSSYFKSLKSQCKVSFCVDPPVCIYLLY